MASSDYRLAATDIASTRDLTPAGTLHAYRDGVGTTACGLELGRQVRLFPNSRWDRRASGSDCPVCAASVEAEG